MVNKDFNDNAHKYCKYAFAVNRSKGCKRITVSEIAYIEAMKDNCIIHMKDGSHHLLTCPMCTVERSLNEEDFMRIHRSFIVNIGFINEYNYGFVVLENGMEVAIGRNYKEALKSSLCFWGQRQRDKKE